MSREERGEEFLPEVEPGYTRWKAPRLTLNKELVESLAAMTNVPIIKDLLEELDDEDEDLEEIDGEWEPDRTPATKELIDEFVQGLSTNSLGQALLEAFAKFNRKKG